MIRLLVDSASDYTQEEIRNKNLYFVPLQIQIEGKNYLDGVDIDKETSVVCEKMQSDIVDTLYPVYTLYSYGLENVEKLESKLDLDVNRVRIGSTIGVHIGPNAFGVCFVSKL